MKIPFTKMSGAGNDFIVIDNRENILSELNVVAKKICNRKNEFGGADGFISIERSDKASFEMKYFNADGSNGAMCGNGGRCAARFALQKDIVSSKHLSFIAIGNMYYADIDGERVRLAMPDPKDIALNFSLIVNRQIVTCHYVNVETPHAIIFIVDIQKVSSTSLDEFDVVGWGKELRWHRNFVPRGANANFAELLSNKMVKLRTYERGVEGETLACGTGSVATAIAAHCLYNIPSPVQILTRSGEILVVGFSDMGGNIHSLSLEGTANILLEGFFEI
jgi:diaminopimelate epimerase